MTRSTITAVAIDDIADDGYNLTDSSDFTAMSTGTGNGVQFVHDPNDIVILKNTTGGGAVFTLVVRATGITDVGGSVTDPTVAVAAGKTHVLPSIPSILHQADGKVYIDCDIAGSILVLNR